VASRYVRAKGWDNPSKLVSDYRMSVDSLAENVSEQRGRAKPNGLILNTYGYIPTIVSGRSLVEWLLQTREIPPGKEKFLELASRALLASKRQQKDVIGWYDKNKPWLQFLSEASDWPERVSGGTQEATVGPFKVHNTVGADANQFNEIQSLFESANRILSATRDFKKVLYGDVYVVGQIKNARTLAWYSLSEDDVYIRSMAKRGFDDLDTLCHELGHRYWYKFAPKPVLEAFNRFYYLMKRSSGVQVEMPKVGDVFPIPLSNRRGPPPVIESDDGYRYGLSGGGFVVKRTVRKILEERAVVAKFPTPYSSKTVEEFFAELFALYALGKLSPDLSSKFEEALGS